MAFSRDSLQLATASFDGVSRCIRSRPLVVPACIHRLRERERGRETDGRTDGLTDRCTGLSQPHPINQTKPNQTESDGAHPRGAGGQGAEGV